MLKKIQLTGLLSLILLFSNCAVLLHRGIEYQRKQENKLIERARKQLNKCISENSTPGYAGPIPAHTKIDSLIFQSENRHFQIHLSKHFSYQPFRPETVAQIYRLFRVYLGRKYQDFEIEIFTIGQPVEKLIPNVFQSFPTKYDFKRLPLTEQHLRKPLVECVNRQLWRPDKGLFNKNIVIAHSHGWYFSQRLNRWEWQRPRLFSRVEDLLPLSFTLPYLVPMLEKAGATVFTTRERDTQINEVIIDNDLSQSDSLTKHYIESPENTWQTVDSIGFSVPPAVISVGYNPFRQGTHRVCLTDSTVTVTAAWLPEIPQTGEYAVYVAYIASAKNSSAAHYRVYHCGGQTDFSVNQKIGGGTWVYLGKFKFNRGIHPAAGKVELLNDSPIPGQRLSADAVRFGGGMGTVVRGGTVSGYPRYAEGARYNLQYFGLPDSLVYNLTQDTNDYQDDYQSRSEYANYLKGNPYGPNENREKAGFQVPIDAYLSFHTDAGIVEDSTIGTLMIYRIADQMGELFFPDGVSRLANRDFADIMQTEIVKMARQKYVPKWTRRALRDADYSEARRPNMPACLLELASHQNFTDMKFMVDPRFRFDISRAIYKGFLKFLAFQYKQEYVVTPLQISHFRAVFSDSAEVQLAWRPVKDWLETSAVAENYIVYTRIDEGGFDNGVVVNDTMLVLENLKKGVIYSFQVTAVNAGGESFPSETLAVGWINELSPPILIVNGFDRIAGPAFVDEPRFKGFLHFLDAGVADKFDFGLAGIQFNFSPKSSYRSNDAPGHGASYANFETKIVAGNSFDYPYSHGTAIRACHRSFISCSDEALQEQLVDLQQIETIDLILGEEKETPPVGKNWYDSFAENEIRFRAFPNALKEALIRFLEKGGNLFVSGAYVGTSLRTQGTPADSVFAEKWLKMKWQTNHAAQSGKIFSVDSTFLSHPATLEFNTQPDSISYAVEAPDAINPAPGAKTILRYAENRFSAAIGYRGTYSVFICGFPYETIISPKDRNRIMQSVLTYFDHK